MKIKRVGKFLSFILGASIIGITLAPFGIFLRERYLYSSSTINHESIHWKQQMEMLIIFFYIWYIVEWGIKYLLHGKMAYYYLSFEREAYKYDDDFEYLKRRKHFAWIKLLRLTK
jgi:hypothetical protein